MTIFITIEPFRMHAVGDTDTWHTIIKVYFRHIFCCLQKLKYFKWQDLHYKCGFKSSLLLLAAGCSNQHNKHITLVWSHIPLEIYQLNHRALFNAPQNTNKYMAIWKNSLGRLKLIALNAIYLWNYAKIFYTLLLLYFKIKCVLYHLHKFVCNQKRNYQHLVQKTKVVA